MCPVLSGIRFFGRFTLCLEQQLQFLYFSNICSITIFLSISFSQQISCFFEIYLCILFIVIGIGSGSAVKSDLDEVLLRKYELSRLRYYFAIAECDSVDTANKLYEVTL